MGCFGRYGKQSIYHKKTRRVKGGLIHSLWIGTGYSGLSTGQTALHRFGTVFPGLGIGFDLGLSGLDFADTKMQRPESSAQHLAIEFNLLIGKLRSD
jgi:hypothetical protein